MFETFLVLQPSCNTRQRRMLALLLLLLLLSSNVSALQLQPQIRLLKQTNLCATTTTLRLKSDIDDERRPLMDMQDDVLTRRVGVKSLDELQPKKVSIPASSFSAAALEKKKEEDAKKKKQTFGSKTFGSISIEDLTAETYISPTGSTISPVLSSSPPLFNNTPITCRQGVHTWESAKEGVYGWYPAAEAFSFLCRCSGDELC